MISTVATLCAEHNNACWANIAVYSACWLVPLTIRVALGHKPSSTSEPLFLLPLPVPLIARCGGGPDLFFLSSSATFLSSVAIFCWSSLLLELRLFATARS